MNRLRILLLCFVLITTIVLVSAHPVAAYPLPEHAWRIPILADGLYALDYETLAQAGVPVAATPPAAYHLSSMGQSVAMWARLSGDGSFDPGDAFLFYGQKFHGTEQDEKYTDENVYWLTIDATTPGLRMSSRSVIPQPAAAPAAFYAATARSEQDNVYWARWSTQPGTSATWFWERTLAVSKPVTRTYPIHLTGVVSAKNSAILQVEVAARSTSSSDYPDHYVHWLINGAEVGEDAWGGMVGRVFTTTVDSALLHDGENQLQMVLLTDTGVQDIYFDRALLTYPRAFIAQDDQLHFSSAVDSSVTYTLTGFSATPAHLIDVSDPLNPVRLTDARPASLPGGLTFSDASPSGTAYAAFVEPLPATAANYSPPADLLQSPAGADEIIIVPSAFHDAIVPLAAQRQSEGLRVQIVRVEDIYALFNGGVFHPRAIQNFLAYAYANWPGPHPAYVLLVGDGHFNFKGHSPDTYGELQPNWIPPFLDFVDPWQGEVAIDSRFAAIVGNDKMPDMAVGRLPVNSVAELDGVVAKLIAYATETPTGWARNAIFVSDNVPDSAGDFDALIDDLQQITPPGIVRQRVSLTTSCGPPFSQPNACATAATQTLIDKWSAGAALLTYSGHGAVNRWGHEPLLTNESLPDLQPGHGLPVVLSLDCLDGYYIMPSSYPGLIDARSLAEIATILPDRGAIAYFAPAGLGTTSDEQQMAFAFYDALFQQGERRLGPLTQAARLASSTHLVEIYTLFGDPAMMLNIQPHSVSLPLQLQQ